MKLTPFQKQHIQTFAHQQEQGRQLFTQNHSKERIDKITNVHQLNFNVSQVNESKDQPIQSYHIAQKFSSNNASKSKITLNAPGREIRTSLQSINSQQDIFLNNQKRNVVKVQSVNTSQINNRRKINTSEVRTNSISSSNSKSRISANMSAMYFLQAGIASNEGDEFSKPTQSALKIKKLIGEQKEGISNINSQFLQNFKTGSSQSPIHRSNKSNVLGCHSTKAASISTDVKGPAFEDIQKYSQVAKGKIVQGIDKGVISQKLNQLQLQVNGVEDINKQKYQIQPQKSETFIQSEQQRINEILQKCNNSVRKCKAQIENVNKDQMEQSSKSREQIEKLQGQMDRNYGSLTSEQKLLFKETMLTISQQCRECKGIEQVAALMNNIQLTVNMIIEGVINQSVMFVIEQINRYTELEQQMLKRNNDQTKANSQIDYLVGENLKLKEIVSIIENERNCLLQKIGQKNPIDTLNDQSTDKKNQKQNKSQNLDDLDTNQLRDISSHLQAKLLEMGEKETKLIKLVLAIKNTGVDIEKIYNEEVLNDDSNVTSSVQAINSYYSLHKKNHSFQSFDGNAADNSVINDSDESSFNFNHEYQNDSMIESLKRGQMDQICNQALQNRQNGNQIKIKLDLSHIQQQQRTRKSSSIIQNPLFKVDKLGAQPLIKYNHEGNQGNIQNLKHDLSQQKINKLYLPFNAGISEPIGFHQEFMSKLPEFSESWRQQAIKDDRKNHLN